MGIIARSDQDEDASVASHGVVLRAIDTYQPSSVGLSSSGLVHCPTSAMGDAGSRIPKPASGAAVSAMHPSGIDAAASPTPDTYPSHAATSSAVALASDV